ncbi:hypothetical protein E3U43_006341 [Larimichthys crocea]|nr:hypothetical protein E3U43_006341 [Larimichthys crocea]
MLSSGCSRRKFRLSRAQTLSAVCFHLQLAAGVLPVCVDVKDVDLKSAARRVTASKFQVCESPD